MSKIESTYIRNKQPELICSKMIFRVIFSAVNTHNNKERFQFNRLNFCLEKIEILITNNYVVKSFSCICECDYITFLF